jgi:hypothetical protein
VRQFRFGSHSSLAFDSESGLLVTSLLQQPPGISRFTDRDEPERTYAQAWLRTPVARGAPRFGRMVTDTTWEVVDLESRSCASSARRPGFPVTASRSAP